MKIKQTVSCELLRRMKRVRMVEETIAERYPDGKMRCPIHLCIGQEAVAAGVGLGLKKNDFTVSTHRGHGHYLGKGGNLNAMIAEIYGKATGCSDGKGGSVHLIDESVGFMGSTDIVAGTIPVGVGLGLSIQLQGTNQISCVFLGDAAVEEGVFYESVNFAALKKLPVLFICENNFYSIQSPLFVRQPKSRTIHKMVEAIGCPAKQGDGNDVEAVYENVVRAVSRIRQGKGPYFLEFYTYRWREHCGPKFDHNNLYRTNQEYLKWKKRDPILIFEKKILGRKDIPKQDITRMEIAIKHEVDLAFDFAEESPFPSVDNLGQGVYTKQMI